MRLLIVDDQEDLTEIMVRKFKSEGYGVDFCFDGEEALHYLELSEYDAVILDIMLPGITGIGVLKQMRSKGIGTPVIMLTALGSVEDRVTGLDAGADDYLVKPFDFQELTARVRALVRRKGSTAKNVLTADDLSMDLSSHEVTRAGQVLNLTAKEFRILECLMVNRGKVMSRDRLLNSIWDYNYDGGSNVVDVFVHNLRKKVDAGHEVKLINTVKGAGYIIR